MLIGFGELYLTLERNQPSSKRVSRTYQNIARKDEAITFKKSLNSLMMVSFAKTIASPDPLCSSLLGLGSDIGNLSVKL